MPREVVMDVRAALKGQYHATLAMLRQAIEQCSDELWDHPADAVAFWRVVYHTLYFTHLYLQQDEATFRPWPRHREGHHDLPRSAAGSAPTLDPYSRIDLLEYWRLCDNMVDACVDRLDLDAPGSGFSWHSRIPKFEHQLHNLRHVQHHAAILSCRLRAAPGAGVEFRWVRTGPIAPG
jgi:hypothetical protein